MGVLLQGGVFLTFWASYDWSTSWAPLRLSWRRHSEVGFLPFSWRIVCWTYKVLTFPLLQEIWSAGFGLYLSWTLPAPRCGPQGDCVKSIIHMAWFGYFYLIACCLALTFFHALRGERRLWRRSLPLLEQEISLILPFLSKRPGNGWLDLHLYVPAYTHCTKMKYTLLDIYDGAYYIKLFWVLNRPGPQSSTSRSFSASHWLSKRIFRPILVIISFEPSLVEVNQAIKAWLF